MDLGKYEDRKNESPTASPTCQCHAECGRGQEKEAAIHTPHRQLCAEVNKFCCALCSATCQRTCLWYDEPRSSNAKWCKEWKGTEWSDVDLTGLMRPTLEGLILTCCDAVNGSLFCVDIRADGRNMCENKDILMVRMGESEHHIAQLCSSSVIGEKLKSSSATVCPTEADSKYLVETASIFAETLGGDSMSVLSAWMTRYATWSMSRFQVKSESRTALLGVLENCRIRDRIASVTAVASELRQRAWITTRYRKEREKREFHAGSRQCQD